MAMPLEEKIMAAIGFEHHYSWYYGSGTCKFICRNAAKQLPTAIREAYANGERIRLPFLALTDKVVQASLSEENRWTVEKTWKQASTTIREHIRRYWTV